MSNEQPIKTWNELAVLMFERTDENKEDISVIKKDLGNIRDRITILEQKRENDLQFLQQEIKLQKSINDTAKSVSKNWGFYLMWAVTTIIALTSLLLKVAK